MKKLAVLFLLTVTVGFAIQWRDPSGQVQTQTQTTIIPALATTSAPAQTPTQPPTAQASPTETIHRLPQSFAGTQVDGRLRTDSLAGWS